MEYATTHIALHLSRYIIGKAVTLFVDANISDQGDWSAVITVDYEVVWIREQRNWRSAKDIIHPSIQLLISDNTAHQGFRSRVRKLLRKKLGF